MSQRTAFHNRSVMHKKAQSHLNEEAPRVAKESKSQIEWRFWDRLHARDVVAVRDLIVQNRNPLVNREDGNGWLPLHVAVINCDAPMVRMLLQNGARRDVPCDMPVDTYGTVECIDAVQLATHFMCIHQHETPNPFACIAEELGLFTDVNRFSLPKPPATTSHVTMPSVEGCAPVSGTVFQSASFIQPQLTAVTSLPEDWQEPKQIVVHNVSKHNGWCGTTAKHMVIALWKILVAKNEHLSRELTDALGGDFMSRLDALVDVVKTPGGDACAHGMVRVSVRAPLATVDLIREATHRRVVAIGQGWFWHVDREIQEKEMKAVQGFVNEGCRQEARVVSCGHRLTAVQEDAHQPLSLHCPVTGKVIARRYWFVEDAVFPRNATATQKTSIAVGHLASTFVTEQTKWKVGQMVDTFWCTQEAAPRVSSFAAPVQSVFRLTGSFDSLLGVTVTLMPDEAMALIHAMNKRCVVTDPDSFWILAAEGDGSSNNDANQQQQQKELQMTTDDQTNEWSWMIRASVDDAFDSAHMTLQPFVVNVEAKKGGRNKPHRHA